VGRLVISWRQHGSNEGKAAVFADLDETIRQILIRHVPLDPTEIEISFEAPDREWSSRLTRPAVNCFLYDVRENVRLRVAGWDTRRTNGQAIRQKGPLRIDATYQITAWARAPEDEHRLLWRVLAALARFMTLPPDLLQGSLKDQPMPIPASIGQPEQMPANFADLWQALDNRIRPALTYVVTLALDPEITFTRPLTLTAPRIELDREDPLAVRRALEVRGRVRDRQDPSRGIAGAVVLLAETGDRTMSDAEGRFVFSAAPRGRITLIVRAAGRDEVIQPATVPSDSYDVEI
jgi:hypothetical protein